MSTAAVDVIPSNRWLLGPRLDLLLGCGVGYYLIFIALSIAGPGFREVYPLGLLPVIALALSVPHYGATLLRVYERTEDQRRYRIFTVYLTAMIGALFVAGVQNSLVASLLITLYLTWSPWHYSGQNYGISVMFLRRRGVELPAQTKKFLHWSFIISFCLPIAEIHGVLGSSSLVDFDTMTRAVEFIPLGLSPTLQNFLFATLGAAYLITTSVAVFGLLRLARASVVLPALILIFTQSLWFVIPTLAQHLGLLQDLDSLAISRAEYAFFWIAIAHAVQYLWITTYFALKQGRAQRASGFYFKALVAGATIWIIPGVLFGPRMLGTMPFDAGLAALVAAVVNIHHFMLDGAIWKLRDGRIAKILFRNTGQPENAGPPSSTATRRWVLRTVAVIGAACVLVSYVGTTEYHLGFRRSFENNDLRRAQQAYTRLEWIGRDSAVLKSRLGLLQARGGLVDEAVVSGQQAVQLDRTAGTLMNLAEIYELGGRFLPAANVALQAIGLDPNDQRHQLKLLDLLSRVAIDDLASRTHALHVLDEFVATYATQDALVLGNAARIYLAAGQPLTAHDLWRKAIDRADPVNDDALIREYKQALTQLTDDGFESP